MKIDGLVVCVDYWAELKLSVRRWQAALDDLLVVTSRDDAETCRAKDVPIWRTETFFQNGAKFNKAAAMQEALDEFHPWRDWVLLIDADIIPPVDLRERLEAADLKPGTLYGAHRHQADPAHWADDPTDHPLFVDREIAGYFQLFHVSDSAVADRHDILNTTYTHAGCYDSEFQNKWGKGAKMDRKAWLDFPVLHIGEPGRNWCGRGNHQDMNALIRARQAGQKWTEETIRPIERAPMKTKPKARRKRKTAKKPTGKKIGRPKGSRNKTKQTVHVIPGRCKKCQSTSRTPYRGHRRTMELIGIAPDGKPFTRIVWRDTKCLECGQHRVDMVYENMTGAK